MQETRTWSLDGYAVGFALVGVVLAISVLTYDPVAESDALAEPGLALAAIWTEGFGWATGLTLVGWGLLACQLALWRSWPRLALRAAGWALLAPASCVVLDRLGPNGAGGAVGACLSAWLEGEYPVTVQVLILVVAVTLGLTLALDSVVLPVVRRLAGLLRKAPGLFKRAPRQVEEPVPVKAPRKAKAAPVDDGAIPITRPGPPAPEPVLEEEEPEADPVAAPLRVVRPGPSVDDERYQDYELPPITLLEDAQPFPHEDHDQHLRETAALLEKTFHDFDLNIKVVGINTGPVITQYEIALETGMRVNKVTGLHEDLALNLKVPSVRIVAPIPGKNTVGIEVPNEHRAIVRLKEVVLTAGKKVAKAKIPLFLGKDTEGRPLTYDLAEMPHLLIAGRTGTGKSVCLNAIILSMLMTRKPDELKLILIDPKRTELIEYSRLPHLLHPVVTDAKKAEAILAWAVDKMEERYDLLSRCRVRSIAAYNELAPAEIHRRLSPADDEERAKIPNHMPYLVLIVDELGDLMMQMKREIEGHIIRLAQKSRAAGIHLIVATQKPTVDVITGLIKSNLPARICFQVSSRSDSRVVLDEMGADKLLGKGDMLLLQPGSGTLARAQGAYASDQEITRVVEHLDCDPCFAEELLNLKSRDEEEEAAELSGDFRSRDDLYEKAITIVVREGRGSVSLLQRALGIGYGRAARLIDFMAQDGIVGAYNGSNAREVLFTPEEWDQKRQSAAS